MILQEGTITGEHESLKGMLHQKDVYCLNLIFWIVLGYCSKGPKNHLDLKILVQDFVPRGFEARRRWDLEAQREWFWGTIGGVLRHDIFEGFKLIEIWLDFDWPCYRLLYAHYRPFFLDAIASPSTYPYQSVGEWVSDWVIDSFRFGDSYRISELCELVLCVPGFLIF